MSNVVRCALVVGCVSGGTGDAGGASSTHDYTLLLGIDSTSEWYGGGLEWLRRPGGFEFQRP